MANNNYVKFIKGSLSAFNKLAHKDSSTLYFITDNETGELRLYLGEALISSNEVKPEQLSLNELLDVTLGETISDGNILTFNGTNWINTSLETFKSWLDIPTMPDVMTGAEADKDGTSGLVPTPMAGNQNNFLRADGNWTDIVPIITTEINKIVDGAPEAFDTLKEIADWIADDNSGATTLVTRVGSLETLTQEHEKEIPLLQTAVGNLEDDVAELQKAVDDLITGGEVDLTGYVTDLEFTSVVGDIKNLNNYNEESPTNLVTEINLLNVAVGDLSNLNAKYEAEGVTSLVNEINGINERLTWQTLEEN